MRTDKDFDYAAAHALLIERGWFFKDAQGEHLGTVRFYYENEACEPPGYSIHPAFAIQKLRDSKKEREDGLKDGKRELPCNKCGRDLRRYDEHPVDYTSHFIGYYGLVDASLTGGYWSDPLKDCTKYTFSLCEHCLDELFKTFKTPPIIEYYI